MEQEIGFALEDGTPEKKISRLADIEIKFKNDLQEINVAEQKPPLKVGMTLLAVRRTSSTPR